MWSWLYGEIEDEEPSAAEQEADPQQKLLKYEILKIVKRGEFKIKKKVKFNIVKSKRNRKRKH